MYGICAINLSATNVLNVYSVLDFVFGAKWLNSKVKALIQHAALPGLDGALGSCIPDDDTMLWCSTDWVTAFHLQWSSKPISLPRGAHGLGQRRICFVGAGGPWWKCELQGQLFLWPFLVGNHSGATGPPFTKHSQKASWKCASCPLAFHVTVPAWMVG